MGFICKIFGHKWNGCKCERCGEMRNAKCDNVEKTTTPNKECNEAINLLNELREISNGGTILSQEVHKRMDKIVDLISEKYPESIENIITEVDAINRREDYRQYGYSFQLCKIIGKIGGERALMYLIKILNTESQYVEYDEVIFGSVIGLKYINDARSIEHLKKVKTRKLQPHIINHINELLSKLGIEDYQPKDIINKGSVMMPKEAVEFLSHYYEQAKNWDKDAKRYYYVTLAAKIECTFEQSKNEEDKSMARKIVLPFLAAAIAADPDPNNMGWNKFDVDYDKKTLETALKLSETYPLPTKIPYPH